MDALEAENRRLREAVLVITREIIEMLRASRNDGQKAVKN